MALKNLNVTFYSGEITVIVGKNGSGKSTLLNIIAKEINPDEGSIIAFGNDLLGDSSKLNSIGFC